MKLAFVGEFGAHRVSPRQLTSDYISSMVNVEGIVTKCSLVRPKILKSVHFVEATGQFITKQYRSVPRPESSCVQMHHMPASVWHPTASTQTGSRRDGTSLDGAPTGSAFPTKDDAGNLLTTEYGLCMYMDHQVVTVQAGSPQPLSARLPRQDYRDIPHQVLPVIRPGSSSLLVHLVSAAFCQLVRRCNSYNGRACAACYRSCPRQRHLASSLAARR